MSGKQRLLGFVVALISVCLLSAAWLAYSSLPGVFKIVSSLFNEETARSISMTEETVPVPTSNENFSDADDAKEQDRQNAIIYLQQDQWHKDSLEHYEVTKGLFEALNGYDFEKITIYSDSLIECYKLKSIKDAIPEDVEKFKNQLYNKDNDPVITIQKYIETITKTKKLKRSQGEQSPSQSGNQGRQEFNK